MLCTPPGVIQFHYGPGSCSAHQRAAREAGIDVRVLRLPGLALDIDTPEDLVALLQFRNKGKIGANTERFLSASGIGEELQRSIIDGPKFRN
jgi:2-phospho-L-lactate guanylyltransferase (CobY/MobA/RfbA family)